MKHSRGRYLAIASDCHSSGHWVSECVKFLDKQGVRPCGHSAKKKGILLKVYTACVTGQDAAELCYAMQGMRLKDDGYVYYQIPKKLNSQQKTCGVNFTFNWCGRKEEEGCIIAPDSTWSTAAAVMRSRIFLLNSCTPSHPAWYYVVLDDDPEKIRDFMHKTQKENVDKYKINMEDYGTILRSGLGTDPPQDAKDWMAEKYGLRFQ